MDSGRRNALVAIVVVLAGGAGFALQRALRPESAARASGNAVAALFKLQLPDLAGRQQSFVQWRGRLLLVNFWATWCEPCREEVPALVRLQAKYGDKSVQLVGISIDSVDKISDFASKFAVNYPLTVGGLESIDLARQLGNRAGALPFTVLISPHGQLIASHLGGMNDRSLSEFVLPHLGS
jgi:thiol-disulfide isomerase/thioredoxin